MIKRISDKVFLTPHGIVDFNKPARLTPDQEFHNRRVEFEKAEQERQYDFEDAMRKWQQPIKVYHMMKDKLEQLSPEEKLDFIPKWIEYRIEWQKTATEADKKYGHPMSLECFMACEINPFKSMNLPFPVLRLKKPYIKYIIA